ncbi:endonuclease [Anaerobacillus alkaliphilus]|uniref:Endonuclease n=1 Tax=Anaerobacillus alkaliphilus TaxID=1548597 RepID=A0A4Q0VXF7_9BACI|nr:endonuclease/exonuclease/phosphatase family protein [Anaerobacillus alkaliphilus]RXJ04364.1 endonuclease [Anaerobacillus alkaliphilus]
MRLLTLNCHSWREKNQLQKIKILARTIKENAYDVIALQEVSQSIFSKKIDKEVKRDHYGQVLLNELRAIGVHDYRLVWSFSHIGYISYEEGVAIITKHPIEETSSFYVSRTTNPLNWKARKIVGVKIQYNGKAISFYTCHLGWWDDKDEPFKDQIDRLMEHVPHDEAYFLLGDFNNDASKGNEGYDYLLQKGLVDTFEMATEKDKGTTVSGNIAGWSKNKQDLRIDYIFTNQEIPVSRSNVIFNGDNKPVISDHFGVELKVF